MGSEMFVVIWVVCGLLGAVIGQSKGRAGAGLALGLLLGLIGVLITALLSRSPERQAQEIGVMHPVLSPVGGPPPSWWADPTGRHQHRYWDGHQWTDWVSDGGRQSMDAISR